MTIGNDVQRSHWVRNDGKISPETMAKPGFEMAWKVKLKNEARQMNSLTPPVLLDFYISYRGFRTLGFLGTSSGAVVAIDTDLSRMEWEKPFGGASAGSGTALCPGGMTSSVTRPTSAAYPAAGGGRGRGSPAKSGVGEPLEGAVTLRERPQQFNFPPPPPPGAGAANRRATAAPNPFGRTPLFVDAVTADGKLHSMYVSNGEEPNPAMDFLPANANAVGLVVFDGSAYVATVNSCGGAENGLWALDLETKKVSHWKAGEAGVAGSAGAAAGPDGTLYVASGSELVALEQDTLKQKHSYKAGEQKFTSTPVVFDYKGKPLVAAATNDGRIHLVDGASMAGLDKSAVYSAAGYAVGALASWQDAGGTRWVLAPGAVGIATWKVVDRNGSPALEAGWVSQKMVSALTPAIVNGVVFAISGGAAGTPAVLYALDGATGKETWNSGKAITSFVRSGGLSAGGGRVYVGAHDGTQYAFGFPMEH